MGSTRAARDEIGAGHYRLPANARRGMFITWSNESDDPQPDHVCEETIACVDSTDDLVCMEWRVARADGSSEVTAVRFRRDGSLLAAWRGPPGGAGRPLRIVDRTPDLSAAMKEADRMRESAGIPAPQVDSTSRIEEVDTPAGRIACTFRRFDASILFFSGHFATWHAIEALPLSSLVRLEDVSPGHRSVTTLLAFGWNGAAETLVIPSEPSLRQGG